MSDDDTTKDCCCDRDRIATELETVRSLLREEKERSKQFRDEISKLVDDYLAKSEVEVYGLCRYGMLLVIDSIRLVLRTTERRDK